MTTFVVSSSLNAYFHDAVTSTLDNMGVEASKYAEFYLVDLLSGFASADRLHRPDDADDESLALLLKKAIESPGDQKVHVLKRLGDVSLYVSGFFGDSLNRKLIDIDYYISMGRTAYTQLRSLMQRHRHGDLFDSLYGELSDKFVPFVDVLGEISDRGKLSNNVDILSVYEKWLKTRSKRLEKKLTNHGVIPNPQREEWEIN